MTDEIEDDVTYKDLVEKYDKHDMTMNERADMFLNFGICEEESSLCNLCVHAKKDCPIIKYCIDTILIPPGHTVKRCRYFSLV